MFGLLGPNGAGKTTTVKILTTLSRRRRARPGSPATTSRATRRGPPGDRRRRPAAGVDPTATGRENLVLQGRLFGLGGRDTRRGSTTLPASSSA